LARGWTIGGVDEPTREAVTAAASEAGMPLGQWVEQALKKALAEGLEAGVSIEEIEARLRRVVSDELQPVWQALARLETTTSAALGQPRDNSSALRLLRGQLRQRRGR
jgi:TRAP-type C4-dicarboxylate transport system substrate-binding protein